MVYNVTMNTLEAATRAGEMAKLWVPTYDLGKSNPLEALESGKGNCFVRAMLAGYVLRLSGYRPEIYANRSHGSCLDAKPSFADIVPGIRTEAGPIRHYGHVVLTLESHDGLTIVDTTRYLKSPDLLETNVYSAAKFSRDSYNVFELDEGLDYYLRALGEPTLPAEQKHRLESKVLEKALRLPSGAGLVY